MVVARGWRLGGARDAVDARAVRPAGHHLGPSLIDERVGVPPHAAVADVEMPGDLSRRSRAAFGQPSKDVRRSYADARFAPRRSSRPSAPDSRWRRPPVLHRRYRRKDDTGRIVLHALASVS